MKERDARRSAVGRAAGTGPWLPQPKERKAGRNFAAKEPQQIAQILQPLKMELERRLAAEQKRPAQVQKPAAFPAQSAVLTPAAAKEPLPQPAPNNKETAQSTALQPVPPQTIAPVTGSGAAAPAPEPQNPRDLPQTLQAEYAWLTETEMMLFLQELCPENKPRYREGDEIGFSLLFGDITENAARFNQTARMWYFYDGTVWREDEAGLRISQYAKMFVRVLCLYASVKDARSQFAARAEKLRSLERRTRLVLDSRDVHPFRTEHLDADPLLFNCKNGVLHLKTGELMPHDPKLLLSRVANVDYDPKASPDMFETFLFEVMDGDAQKAFALRDALGYALLGTAPLHCCFLFYGATTRNGKSTLTETIRFLFGSYGSTVEPATLARQRENAGTARGDLAKLCGVRFLQMSEPPRGMHFDEALLKKLTGQDTITARHLYQREVEFTPVFKLFINTNYLPAVSDNTLFSSGRLRVVPFERHFSEQEQDKALPRRLREPQNLSGALNSLLAGLEHYYALGGRLPVPESVRRATEQYAADSDKLRRFFADCMHAAPNAATPMREAYAAYAAWCRESGYAAENKTGFIAELRRRGLVNKWPVKINGVPYRNAIVGYTLQNQLF